MSEITTVVLDAMGGDNAPAAMIDGAIDAISKEKNVKVILVGIEDVIRKGLEGKTYNPEQIEIVNATEVIETAEPPVHAIRRKKDSSIVVGMKLVKEGKANVDARPAHLLQFAKMGSIYMENVLGIKDPKVGIVNIGAEEEKGNALVKDTFPQLKELPGINFIGSVEAREIPHGQADVIVCEAFVGNVILKLYEGLGAVLVDKIKGGMMSTLRSKIGALLVKPALKTTLKTFDATEYGGAPLLGLNGLVVKTHGSAKAKEVTNTIIQCVTFKQQNISEKIKASIQAEEAAAE